MTICTIVCVVTLSAAQCHKQSTQDTLLHAKHSICKQPISFLIMYAGPWVDELFQLNLSDIELREESGSLHIRKGEKGSSNAEHRFLDLHRKLSRLGWRRSEILRLALARTRLCLFASVTKLEGRCQSGQY